MNRKSILRAIVIFAMVATNVGCDQVSKSLVRNRIGEYEQISVVENYIKLMRVENEGAFLSLGTSLPKMARFILLSLFPLAMLGFGIGYIFTRKNLSRAITFGFAFVIGGGLGNLYDRLVYGSVTDFLHIDFVLFQTGIFNMADVSIMTGMAIVLIGSFTNRSKPDSVTPAG
ncbi:MAG TPA: signal peptidase II [Cyclobacteriaceae bacterium]|nr:signal peptidase II [Cyclobacteriaceae bacterium]